MSAPSPFRSDQLALAYRFAAVSREPAPALPASARCRAIYASRGGRIVGGAFSVLGVVALLVALLFFWEWRYVFEEFAGTPRRSPLALIVLISVLAPLLFGALGRQLFAARLRRLLRRDPAGSGDLARDIEALRRETPHRRTRALADRLETWSVALPLCAASVFGTMAVHHLLMQVLFFGMGERLAPDVGIALQWVIFGVPYLILAVSSVLFARRLRHFGEDELRERWFGGWATLACALSGLLWIKVPQFTMTIVATACLYIPFAFTLVARRVAHERGDLTTPEVDERIGG